jgi:hypothetical protein
MLHLMEGETDLNVVDKLINIGTVEVEGNKVVFTLASTSS